MPARHYYPAVTRIALGAALAALLNAIGVFGVNATPLHEAILDQDIERTRALLAPSQGINERDRAGMAPIHYAVLEDRVELVEMLLQVGADLDIAVDTSEAEVAHYVSLHEFFPLHIAANRNSLEVADLLIARGASVHRTTDDRRSALHIAARKGNHRLARLLIDHGAVIDARDFESYTPLYDAACYGRLAVVELLLANGADVTAQGDDGQTAYDCAVDRDQDDVVIYLERLGITT